MSEQSSLALADYRRQVAALYTRVRRGEGTPETRLAEYRRQRDVLFAAHPQSALTAEQKAAFTGLDYYPYNRGLRFVLPVDDRVDREIFETELADDGLFRYQRVGRIRFEFQGADAELYLYWILGYGGGLYLPFRDLSNGAGTFPGGRYLLDTLKHADLGTEDGRLVIDFNYAYNPSCAYHPRWHCPLPPQENWLKIAIPAGEKDFRGRHEG